MNVTALMLHGLSAMSVYTDLILVRVLSLASVISVLALVGIAIVVFIKFFTDLVIPGWATTVVGDLLIILLQTFTLAIAMTFLLLAGRNQRPFVPIVDTGTFVMKETVVATTPFEVSSPHETCQKSKS